MDDGLNVFFSSAQSIVVLSREAYPGLFGPVAATLANSFFAEGIQALEAGECFFFLWVCMYDCLTLLLSLVLSVSYSLIFLLLEGCREISMWPRPSPGARLSLPLLETIMDVRLPQQGDVGLTGGESSPRLSLV